MKTAVKIWGVSLLLLTLMAPPGYAKMQHDMAMAAIPNMQCFACTGSSLIHRGLEEGALAFVDSNSTYVNVPQQLLWADYIKTANADSDNPHIEYELTVIDCTLYIIVDDLVGVLPWMTSADPDVGGAVFEDTGLDITVHPESLANHICSIWAARLGPGTYTLGPQNNGLGNMYGIAAVTHPLALLSLYPNADGTGEPALYAGHYNLETESSKYYNSGHEMPDGTYSRYYYSGPAEVRETLEMIVERYEYAEGGGEGSRTLAAAQYNDENQIIQIEQVNKDPSEPNDVFTFEYDDKGRLISVEFLKGGPMGALMGGMTIGDYCDRCSWILRSYPGQCTYTNLEDPNRIFEIYTDYDVKGHLTSLKTVRNSLGQLFTFGYDPNGRTTVVNYVEDKDGSGNYDTPVLNGICTYDTNNMLVQIYDTVSDSNILEWQHTGDTENIKIRSVIGEPNADTLSVTKVNWENITIEKNGVPYAAVSVPDDNGLPVTLRNWDWCSDCASPNKVSADISWARLDSDLGDPNISDRIVLPLLNPNDRLETTVSAKKKNIEIHGLKGFTYKVYKDRQDVRGIGVNERIGVVYGRLHVKGKILTGGDQESILSVLHVDIRGKVLVHSNSELLSLPPDDDMSGIILSIMQDSYPESLGVKLMPIYGTSGDGTPYIAGAVTPEGVYNYFKYNNNGDIEAVIRMNDVSEANCTEEIEGDVSGDCKVDFWDLAMVADDWLKCNLNPPTACWE